MHTLLLALIDLPFLEWSPEQWLGLLARLHPLLVHFPIGLLVCAAFFGFFLGRRASPARQKAVGMLLSFGALSAALSAWSGWAYAELEPVGRSLERTLFLHRWGGVGVAAFSWIVLFLGRAARGPEGPRGLFRVSLLVLLAGVGATGHFGATMVHGEDYLIEALTPEPAATTNDVDALRTAEGVDFARDVEPILRARCYDCHGPKRQRGHLRLDGIAAGLDALLAMDPDLIRPGDPASSELFERVVLPADDEDRMPGDGPPLSAQQIDVLERWIAEGARVDVGKSEISTEPPEPERAADSPHAREAQLSELREQGLWAAPTAQSSSGVEVSFAVSRTPVGNDDLAALTGLEPYLESLDLSKTLVDDDGVSKLDSFEALRNLRLCETAVGDRGLAALARLPELESLNLYGTRVTDEGLQQLASLPKLRKLYVWNTSVSPAAIEQLEAAIPGLEVVH